MKLSLFSLVWGLFKPFCRTGHLFNCCGCGKNLFHYFRFYEPFAGHLSLSKASRSDNRLAFSCLLGVSHLKHRFLASGSCLCTSNGVPATFFDQPISVEFSRFSPMRCDSGKMFESVDRDH